MGLNCVIEPVFTLAFSLPILSAVVLQEFRHLFAHSGKPLAISFRRNAQNLARNAAVHLEHGSQDEDAPALSVKTLQHDVGAGQLQFLRQKGLFDILCQIRKILCRPIFDIVAVVFKTERMLCEHTLFVILQMI